MSAKSQANARRGQLGSDNSPLELQDAPDCP
jgi:hypothetical protein